MTLFLQAFEEVGGLDRIDELQRHENEDIYKCVAEMIDSYFPEVGQQKPNIRCVFYVITKIFIVYP